STLSTTLGKHFLLSLPTMAPHHQNSVVFYLYTEDVDSFKVVLTTEHYKLGPKLSTDIVLSRLKDESYRLHPKY
ncbi:hypothetical protein BgiBS90_013694, partial [Biomphalaria glabrata]